MQKQVFEQENAQIVKIAKAEDQERKRISRDLHDNMGAYTTALIANVQQANNQGTTPEILSNMRSNADQILESLRETIWVLNNKEIGIQEFSDSFKNYCSKVLKNFEHINFIVKEEIKNNVSLSANKAIHLNKIMQEAIQNILKHANATEIIYTLKDSQNLEIEIADNGIGFDTLTTKRNNGLDNMDWRAKEINFKVTIESILQNGSTVHLKQIKNA